MSNDMVPRQMTGREANLIYKTRLSGERGRRTELSSYESSFEVVRQPRQPL